MALKARHVTYLLGVMLMLCGGTPYMVSMFANSYKSRFELNESQTLFVRINPTGPHPIPASAHTYAHTPTRTPTR